MNAQFFITSAKFVGVFLVGAGTGWFGKGWRSKAILNKACKLYENDGNTACSEYLAKKFKNEADCKAAHDIVIERVRMAHEKRAANIATGSHEAQSA